MVVRMVSFTLATTYTIHAQNLRKDDPTDDTMANPHLRWNPIWYRNLPDPPKSYNLPHGRLRSLLCQRSSSDRRPTLHRWCDFPLVQWTHVSFLWRRMGNERFCLPVHGLCPHSIGFVGV